MKRFRKVYLEISNVCNLRCAFCPGTRRERRIMHEEEFTRLLARLRPWTDYLYFHLMGEPLCHPQLGRYLSLAGEYGFRVILTTNGTLLPAQQALLLSAPALHKVNISLHAFEANDLRMPFSQYLDGCLRFGQAAEGTPRLLPPVEQRRAGRGKRHDPRCACARISAAVGAGAARHPHRRARLFGTWRQIRLAGSCRPGWL